MPNPPRVPLVQLPTPCHALPRLGAELNLDLWIKRDDLTGLAGGGNKGRKLEFLIADALAQGATTVVTCGAAQSNFVRQLGAAGAMHGLRVEAVLMDLPYDVGCELDVVPAARGGNRVLNAWVGVIEHRIPNGTWDELYAHAADLAAQRRSEGEVVVEIPVGGSSPLGAYAFALAATEVREGGWDAVVVPTSSGSTHTGLAMGLHGVTRVVGIACDPEPEMPHDLAELSARLHTLQPDLPALAANALEYHLVAVGPGYGVPSAGSLAAIQRLARTEGVLLDPIYSGKAMDGLIQLAEAGELRGRVVFWHTGGLPTLWATA